MAYKLARQYKKNPVNVTDNKFHILEVDGILGMTLGGGFCSLSSVETVDGDDLPDYIRKDQICHHCLSRATAPILREMFQQPMAEHHVGFRVLKSKGDKGMNQISRIDKDTVNIDGEKYIKVSSIPPAKTVDCRVVKVMPTYLEGQSYLDIVLVDADDPTMMSSMKVKPGQKIKIVLE